MKRQLLLVLLAIYTTNCFSGFFGQNDECRALEARGISVSMARYDIDYPESQGEIVLFSISNKSPRDVIYDPKKIAHYLSDNGATFQDVVKKKRRFIVNLGVGLLGISLGYLALGKMAEIEEIARFIQDQARLNQAVTNGQLQFRVALPGEAMKLVLPMVLLCGAEAGLLGKSFFTLSPKNIVHEKKVIRAGESLKVLLWLKDAQNNRYMVINQALF